jgi:hypothetical protein
MAVQQQPLLLAQGLEAAFKAAATAGTQLLEAAGTAAQQLQERIPAAAAAYLESQQQQGRDAAAAAQAAAAADAVLHETAAYSMLLSGIRCVSKAAAASSSVLSNPDSLVECLEILGLIHQLKMPVLQQISTILNAGAQLPTHDAAVSCSAEHTVEAAQLLLASVQHSTVLAATAMHALASLLLAWQAADVSNAAVPRSSNGLRRRTSTQSSSSSSSVTTARRNKVVSAVRRSAASILLEDLPSVVSFLVEHLERAFNIVRDGSSRLVVRDAPNRLGRGAAGLRKLQQQVIDIKAKLAEVGTAQVPAAAAAIMSAASPAVVVATAAAAYDSQMLQQLQRYTAAVAATMPAAVLGTCSNIACTNTSPCMKLSRCSNCKACFFCGAECQVGGGLR